MNPTGSDARPPPALGNLDQIEPAHLSGSLPIALCLVDHGLRVVRLNDHLVSLLHIPAERHAGRLLDEVMPALAEELSPLCRRVLATGRPLLGIEIGGSRDAAIGEEQRLWVDLSPLRAVDGTAVAVSLVFTTVPGATTVAGGAAAASALAGEPHRRGSDHLAVLDVTRLPGLVFALDAKRRLRLWNRNLAILAGLGSGELAQGCDFDRLVVPADRARAEREITAAMRGAEITLELGLARAVAGPLPCLFALRRIGADEIESAGEIGGGSDERPCLVAVGSDLSARKLLEDRLRKERDRAQEYVNIAGTIMVVIGSDERIVTMNRKGCEVLRCREQDVTGRNWFDSFIPARMREDVRRVFRDLLAGRIGTDPAAFHENPVLTTAGEERIVAWHNTVIRDKTGQVTGTLSSGEDVTDRLRAAATLAESEAALRRSHAEIRDLAGRLLTAQEDERRRVARELHDDVSQTLALLAIDLDRLQLDPPADRRVLAARLQEIVARVQGISIDMHSLSRRLHPTQLELQGLAPALRELTASLAEHHDLDIRFEYDREPTALPPDVALCLYRVAQESLQNVVKHSRSKEARVELLEEGGAVHLLVTDTGTGFDPAAAPANGGLGLISMKERLRLVGGELSVRSCPGSGTQIEAIVSLAHDRTGEGGR